MKMNKNSNKKQINEVKKSDVRVIFRNIIKNNIKINLELKMIFNFLLFIWLIFLPTYLLKEIKLRKIAFTSQIDITIKGDGIQKILSDFNGEIGGQICNFTTMPNEIIVNGQAYTSINKTINNLTEEINNITMKWETDIDSCRVMFRGLSNLIKVDLTKFDASKVTDMSYMFYECIALESIEINEFNTRSLIDMKYMFYGCISLKYLNFSNINTTSVTYMDHMFLNCLVLTSVDW